MTDINPIFIEVSLMIIVATAVAAVMQLLRQPLIIGHIITGLLVGPQVFNLLRSTEILNTFAQFGIALLLFIVGLNLSPLVIKEVGRVAALSGLVQVILTLALGFMLAQGLGFDLTSSLYIGLALSFSSTIIILKLLSDKKDLGRQYAKISIGILLLQDIVATLILIFTSAEAEGFISWTLLTETILKGGLLIALLAFVSVFILPRLSAFFAQSQEFLYLFAISWGLGLATLFQAMGFSIEIGALFAGIALASSPYNIEISSRLRPLRDFFVVLFFVLLGTQIQLGQLSGNWATIVILSLFVLFIKPIIVMLIVSWLDYNKKTSFKTGLTVGQISEFSLILMLLGHNIGDLTQETLSLITFIGLITIAGSTYMILYADRLYNWLTPILNLMMKPVTLTESQTKNEYEIILFGYNTVGDDFIRSFKKLGKQFLVVDYDPEVINYLQQKKINSLYGDASDNEFLDGLGLEKTKMVVSTITDFETSYFLVKHVRSVNKRTIVIMKSDTIEEASSLYEVGATYVAMPHYLSTNYASMLIHKHGFDLSEFIAEREKHRHYLEKRRKSDYHAKTAEL